MYGIARFAGFPDQPVLRAGVRFDVDDPVGETLAGEQRLEPRAIGAPLRAEDGEVVPLEPLENRLAFARRHGPPYLRPARSIAIRPRVDDA